VNNQLLAWLLPCSTIIVQPILVENLDRGDSRWAFGLSSLVAKKSENMDCLAACPRCFEWADSCDYPEHDFV